MNIEWLTNRMASGVRYKEINIIVRPLQVILQMVSGPKTSLIACGRAALSLLVHLMNLIILQMKSLSHFHMDHSAHAS